MKEEKALVDFLNNAIIQRHLNIEPGGPVQSARINHQGHFAFVLLRSREEATNAIQLAGIPCFGNTLRVDRPKGFHQKFGGGPGHGGQMDESQLLASALLNCPAIPNIPGLNREELKSRLEQSIGQYGSPSSLVLLSNLDGATQEEVELEVKRYGNVLGIRPKPEEQGVFYIKMSSIQEAEKLVQIRRRFADRVVQAMFRPLTEWTSVQ